MRLRLLSCSLQIVTYLLGNISVSPSNYQTKNDEKTNHTESQEGFEFLNATVDDHSTTVISPWRHNVLPETRVEVNDGNKYLREWLKELQLQTVRNSIGIKCDPVSFVNWCEYVLRIQTLLKVEIFDYTDYLSTWVNSRFYGDVDYDDDDFHDYDDERLTQDTVLTNISVRGLAASRDIQPGEIIISIPSDVLISVHNTIDRDPILSQVIGIDARLAYGWAKTVHAADCTIVIEEDPYYEVPLLAVAILYHRSLGPEVSPIWPYISTVLSAPVESMPLLWDAKVLKEVKSHGLKSLILRMKKNVNHMYKTVMKVLIQDHAHIFAPPAYYNDNVTISVEWMFSLEKFKWAFVIVNSRHWKLASQAWSEENYRPYPQPLGQSQHVVAEKVSDYEPCTVNKSQTIYLENNERFQKHPFLAPFADMLNFGPPCTNVNYNSHRKMFEIVALCPFSAGQEVTLWYSDDCDDIMIANYGFTHPLIPRCPSIDELRSQNLVWKSEIEALSDSLTEAYAELTTLAQEAETLRSKCDCGGVPPEEKDKITSDTVESQRVLNMDIGMREHKNVSNDRAGEKNGHGGIRRITRRSVEDIGL